MIFILLTLFVVIWILAVVIFGGDPRPSQQVASRFARKAGWMGALLGILVSLVSMAVLYLFQRTPDAGDWLLWIWPSSLGLMALENNHSALGVVVTFLITIGWNVLLYAWHRVECRLRLRADFQARTKVSSEFRRETWNLDPHPRRRHRLSLIERCHRHAARKDPGFYASL